MLKKYSICLLSVFLFPFLVYAQNNYSVEQTSSGAKTIPQADTFPGMPGMSPLGMRWIPGHFKTVDGRRKMILGHYEPVEGDSSAPQKLPAAERQSGDNTPLPLRGGGRLSSGGQTKDAKRWIPGHSEVRNGKTFFIRGHYANEEGTVAGPSRDYLNPSVTDKTTLGDTRFSSVKPQGWGVVIGISKYKYAAGEFPELHYAARQAKQAWSIIVESLLLAPPPATLQVEAEAYFKVSRII